MRISALTLHDVNDAYALSAAEGWNQTAADWERLIRLHPEGSFSARSGDRLIGTVTTAVYGHELAWIGMMLVASAFRRQGVGSALMRVAIDHARVWSIPTIKLDATPAGRPLYESLGFVAETEFERWQGVAARADARSTADRAAESGMVPLDRAVFGADRSDLLRLLVSDAVVAPLVVSSSAGSGYCLARGGRSATYIGPLMASTGAVAIRLLESALGMLSGTEVCIDINVAGLLERRVLVDCGFTRRRGLTRMCLGLASGAGTSVSLCASAGPEYG